MGLGPSLWPLARLEDALAAYKLGSPGCCCLSGVLCLRVVGACAAQAIAGSNVTIRKGSSSGDLLFSCTTGSDGSCESCFAFAFNGPTRVWISATSTDSGTYQDAGFLVDLVQGTSNRSVALPLLTGLSCCGGSSSSPGAIFPFPGSPLTIHDPVYGDLVGSHGDSGYGSYCNGDAKFSYPGSTSPFCPAKTGVYACYGFECVGTNEYFASTPAFFGLAVNYSSRGFDSFGLPNRCPTAPGFSGPNLDATAYFKMTSYSLSGRMMQFEAAGLNYSSIGDSSIPLYPGGGAVITVTW